MPLASRAHMYRAGLKVARSARIFSASVFLALTLLHLGDGPRISPLAMAAAAFVVAPAVVETFWHHQM